MSISEMPFRTGGIGEVLINMGGDSIRIVARNAGRLPNLAERPPKPYSKDHQARRGNIKRISFIPDELRPAYESVEASLLAVLGMSSSEDAGEQGLGDRGGSATPQVNLALLRQRLTNRQIVEEFLNSKALKEFRKDPFAKNKVFEAIASLRNVTPRNAVS